MYCGLVQTILDITITITILHEYNVLCFVHKCYYSNLATPNVFKEGVEKHDNDIRF